MVWKVLHWAHVWKIFQKSSSTFPMLIEHYPRILQHLSSITRRAYEEFSMLIDHRPKRSRNLSMNTRRVRIPFRLYWKNYRHISSTIQRGSSIYLASLEELLKLIERQPKSFPKLLFTPKRVSYNHYPKSLWVSL